MMSERLLYVIDDGNTDKKVEMLQAQILPENIKADVAVVPKGCDKAVYYNMVGMESDADYTIYLNGDFFICGADMTVMLIEAL